MIGKKSADIFWFSLFHEIKHVLQQKIKKVIISDDGDLSIDNSELEKEADNFAKDLLIPKAAYESFIKETELTKKNIIEFAEKVDIDPCIVVGRLQKEGKLNYNQFYGLKKKYTILIPYKTQ